MTSTLNINNLIFIDGQLYKRCYIDIRLVEWENTEQNWITYKKTNIPSNIFCRKLAFARWYRIKHSFWRIYWCVNSGHFTHRLNKSAKHFYVKFVSKMSRVYTSINSSKGMFNSYNSNSLALCTSFQIFEKLPCTTLFESFLAKRPTQQWNGET
jgi:hypothetical protein